MAQKILARGSLYNSYAIAIFYGAWASVFVGFNFGVLIDTPVIQRASITIINYWTTIIVFGLSAILLTVARLFKLRYVAGFVSSVPPLYQLFIFVFYPLSHAPVTVNYLGLVLWSWLLPMVVLLVHWEHERLEWIDSGRGDPILIIEPREKETNVESNQPT